jgi:hypothetical protein
MSILAPGQLLERDTLQLQRILTETSTWTNDDSQSRRRLNVPTHTDLTLQTFSADDLDETPGTAPRHHLSHQ